MAKFSDAGNWYVVVRERGSRKTLDRIGPYANAGAALSRKQQVRSQAGVATPDRGGYDVPVDVEIVQMIAAGDSALPDPTHELGFKDSREELGGVAIELSAVYRQPEHGQNLMRLRPGQKFVWVEISGIGSGGTYNFGYGEGGIVSDGYSKIPMKYKKAAERGLQLAKQAVGR